MTAQSLRVECDKDDNWRDVKSVRWQLCTCSTSLHNVHFGMYLVLRTTLCYICESGNSVKCAGNIKFLSDEKQNNTS